MDDNKIILESGKTYHLDEVSKWLPFLSNVFDYYQGDDYDRSSDTGDGFITLRRSVSLVVGRELC